MRSVLPTVLLLALAASPVSAQTPTAEDSAGVQAALQHYLNGVIIAKSFNSAPKSR